MPLLSVLTRLYAYRSLVLLLLLGIAAGLVYYLYHQTVVKEAEKQSILTLYSAPPPPVRIIDRQGRETVRVVTPVISPAVLQQLRAGFATEMRDQLRAEFGRNARLLGAQRSATVTQQQLPTVVLRDTTVRLTTPAGVVSQAAKAGKFKDEWLSLTGIVTEDSLSVDYRIRNDFDIRAYSKRDAKHWWQFWAPRKVYVDLKNKNPHTVTTGIDAVRVQKE